MTIKKREVFIDLSEEHRLGNTIRVKNDSCRFDGITHLFHLTLQRNGKDIGRIEDLAIRENGDRMTVTGVYITPIESIGRR